MKEESMTYEQAIERLEQIATGLEQQQTGLDELTDRLREAQKLLKFCKDRLLKAEKEIEEIINGDGTR